MMNFEQKEVAITVNDLNLHYGDKQALHNISLQIPEKKVTAFIGRRGKRGR